MITARVAFGCTVIEPPVKEAIKQAEIVFSGSIAGIRESEIVFLVDRVWKGHVPRVFAMPKIIYSETPCMPGFYSGWVKVGAKFLVYARREIPGLKSNGYFPAPGSRTSPIERRGDDLRKLGNGHLPR